MPPIEGERVSERVGVVNDHIACENRHDLEGVMATFGAGARYDDEPWADHRIGLEGVRTYYTELLRALPDLKIEVVRNHVTAESVIVEVIISGTHRGPWRGLPATGRPLQFSLCGIYEFDEDNRLAAERIYYDRGVVLGQLGMFHEPARGLGRVVTVLSHPLTIARAVLGRRP